MVGHSTEHLLNYLSQIDSTHPLTLFNAGTIHFDRGDFERACYFYEQLLSTSKKEDPRIYFNLAIAYENRSLTQQAVASYEQVTTTINSSA